MNRMQLAALIAALGFFASRCLAQTNSGKLEHGPTPAATFPEGVPPPVIIDKFTADPHAVVVGDTYYIYPTVDKENWLTTEFNVWSSKDLIHWKNEGVILIWPARPRGTVTFRGRKFEAGGWASLCGMGRFTITSAATRISALPWPISRPVRSKMRWVAPLIAKGAYRGQMIDPAPFVDDVPAPDAPAGTGPQAYLYFGNGSLYVAKLNDDMISSARRRECRSLVTARRFAKASSSSGERHVLLHVERGRRTLAQLSRGVWHGGFTAGADPGCQGSCDFQQVGLGSRHRTSSVINVPGTDHWYIVYHRHAVPGGNGFIRETCLGKMEFAPDPEGGPDLIKPVDVTQSAFPDGSKGGEVPAMRSNRSCGIWLAIASSPAAH